MITTHSSEGLTWIDLVSPEDEEIAGLVQKHHLSALVGEELKSSDSMAKISFYDNYVLVVLTLPVRTKAGDKYSIADKEIDFVIGKDFLITSRYDTVEQLEYFAKIFEANAILDKGGKINRSGDLFYYMIKKLYSGMREDLENIRDALVSAETKIFEGNEKNMVEVLSNIGRELIDFRQTARVHQDIWESALAEQKNGNRELFGSDFKWYMQDLKDQFNGISDLITNARELLADLRETNNSLLNTKQNEIIKTLTVISLVFSPLTFIAALFTIPALDVPIISQPYGWEGISLFMVLVVATIWVTFKSKHWV